MEGFGPKRKHPLITAEKLKNKLSYDEKSGLFTWRADGKGGRGIRRGAVAGNVDTNGYRYIRVDGRDYLAQRLAWFYVHGQWPQGIVRFLDENKDNCAILNLRNSSVTLAPSAAHDWRTREGRSAQRKEYYQNNRDKSRDWQLRQSFGISLEEYNQMHAAQSGLCAICFQPEAAKRNGKLRWLAVDHCHASNKVRGLLCGNCNPMIGYAKDSVEVLGKAIEYLNSYKGAA